MNYQLTDLVPCTDQDIIYIVGSNNYLYVISPSENTTWKELIEKSTMNYKVKHGSCIIIIESPSTGNAYQFGNYDRKYVYEHGKTKGYA